MPVVKKKVKITITKKRNGLHKLVIDPIDAWIKTTGEQVTWTSTNADVFVTLDKDGCPFTTPAFFSPKGTELGATGEPINTTERMYSYTLTVIPNPPIPLGTHGVVPPILIDPQVVIDDGGPPSGGGGSTKKRASKKRAHKKRARKR